MEPYKFIKQEGSSVPVCFSGKSKEKGDSCPLLLLVLADLLTSKVAGDSRHVATHQPYSDGQAVVLENVRHQVHMIGAFAGLVCCCVESSSC